MEEKCKGQYRVLFTYKSSKLTHTITSASLYRKQVKGGKTIKNLLLIEYKHFSILKVIYGISQVLLQSSKHS